MSKSFSDIASMISPSNNLLFDRFVNVTLSQRMEDAVKEAESNKNLYDFTLKSVTPKVFRIVTPKFGQKPNITVSASMSTQEVVHSVTITIFNIDANIDFNDFRYVDVELGYMKSGFSAHFRGEIINIYMAKPNPNGELVITCANAQLSDAVTMNNYKIQFDADSYGFKTFINTVSTQIGVPIRAESIPQTDWIKQKFTVNKSVYQFGSILSVITWLNSLFLSVSEHMITDLSAESGISTANVGINSVTVSHKGLTPIAAVLSSDGIIDIKGRYKNDGIKPTMKALSNIGSAYMAGDAVGTITAPYNPDISVGDFVYVNPAYFKTRVAGHIGFNKGKMSSIWCVNTMQFTFSTYTTNTMTLQLNNVQNDIYYEG